MRQSPTLILLASFAALGCGAVAAVIVIRVRRRRPRPLTVVTKRSPRSVDETVARLVSLCDAKGLKVFAVIDHSGEAAANGLELRQTKVVIFGSPLAGTPVMEAVPGVALDLPLKVLVWDDDGADDDRLHRAVRVGRAVRTAGRSGGAACRDRASRLTRSSLREMIGA